MSGGDEGDRERADGGGTGPDEDEREAEGAVREEELLRIIERLRAGEEPGPDSTRGAVHRLSRERAEGAAEGGTEGEAAEGAAAEGERREGEAAEGEEGEGTRERPRRKPSQGRPPAPL